MSNKVAHLSGYLAYLYYIACLGIAYFGEVRLFAALLSRTKSDIGGLKCSFHNRVGR